MEGSEKAITTPIDIERVGTMKTSNVSSIKDNNNDEIIKNKKTDLECVIEEENDDENNDLLEAILDVEDDEEASILESTNDESLSDAEDILNVEDEETPPPPPKDASKADEGKNSDDITNDNESSSANEEILVVEDEKAPIPKEKEDEEEELSSKTEKESSQEKEEITPKEVGSLVLTKEESLRKEEESPTSSLPISTFTLDNDDEEAATFTKKDGSNTGKNSFFAKYFYIIVGVLLLILIVICLIFLLPRDPVIDRSIDVPPTSIAASLNSLWNPLGPEMKGSVNEIGFGESLNLSSDGAVMAIGSNEINNFEGQVEVREYTGIGWIQIGSIISGGFQGGNFGKAVQLSGDGKILVVSGYGSNLLYGKHKGSVRAYTLDESNEWVQFGNSVYGDIEGDRFGISLSMATDGMSWIVGADNFRVNIKERDGYGKVYELIDGNWVQKGSTIDGINESRTGYSVAMSGDGNTVCVGDRWYTLLLDFSEEQRGRVRCFQWNDNSSDWIPKGVNIVGEVANGQMGYSTSLSYNGNRIAIGNKEGGDIEQGSVSVFELNNNDIWERMGSEQISSEAGDQGGFKVELNDDGSVLAWTARGYNNAEEDLLDTRFVRVANWNNGEWEKLGNDLMGQEAREFLGESIALSADGTIIARKKRLCARKRTNE